MSSIYRDDNNYIRVNEVNYIEADVYEEIINDIEERVNRIRANMQLSTRWIGEAFDEVEELYNNFR